MAKVTNNEYDKMVKKASPNSPLWKNMLLAFLIGGAICCVAQGFRNIFSDIVGLGDVETGTATSVVMVFLGVFFTALGLYEKLAKYGGAGTLVPITGFANAVSSPAIEFRAEGIVTGVCSKMFVIAGPVIVASAICSAVYGVVLAIIQ